jgi:aminoglycoside phosphotransferase (APT) family kinase protein
VLGLLKAWRLDLSAPSRPVSWLALGQLFGAFAGIGGVGYQRAQAVEGIGAVAAAAVGLARRRAGRRSYGHRVASPSAPEPEEVSSALRRRLAGRFPGEVTDAEAPTRISGGLDFWVYGLHFAGPGLPEQWGAPLVARIAARPGRFPLMERGSRLQDWVAAHGYPAPPVLDLVPPGELLEFPVQVMERASGTTVAQAITAAPRHMLRLTGQLGTCHAALHRLPVPEWAGEWSMAGNRLRLPRRLAANGSVPGLAEAVERTELILPRLEHGAAAICHGDFHVANVLIDQGKLAVIDWTDTGTGDRHGDIARTVWVFGFAAAAAPRLRGRLVLRAVTPALSRAYLSAYRRELPVDAARLRLWMPLHFLHAWAMLAAGEQQPAGRSPFRPGLAAWARSQFWRHLNGLPSVPGR